MPDSPALPAIRERLAKAQAEADRRQWNWPEQPHRQALIADALALLSLVARLQGEREELRSALVGLCVVRVDGRSCWCEEEWLLRHAAEGHTEACRAARAALGEEVE